MAIPITGTSSNDILERIRIAHDKDIDLSLRPAYAHLLKALGNPETALQNVIHVAGTILNYPGDGHILASPSIVSGSDSAL